MYAAHIAMNPTFLVFDARALNSSPLAPPLRICIIDGHVWLAGIDVLLIIGYSDASLDAFADRHKRLLSDIVDQPDRQEIMVSEEGVLVFLIENASSHTALFAEWYHARVAPAVVQKIRACVGLRDCAMADVPMPFPVPMPARYVVIGSRYKYRIGGALQVLATDVVNKKEYRVYHYVENTDADACMRRVYALAGDRYVNGQYRLIIKMSLEALIELVDLVCASINAWKCAHPDVLEADMRITIRGRK